MSLEIPDEGEVQYSWRYCSGYFDWFVRSCALSPVGDVVLILLSFTGAFCVPCSLVQESREIGEEEQMLRAGGGVEGGAQIGAYRDEENMVQ